MYVSIHAPHEGERPFIRKKQGLFMTFQSTLPTRGSDVGMLAQSVSASSFNPRSPRGGATYTPTCPILPLAFQSTLPTRGSDSSFTASSNDIKVSIHAPHEGERRVCPCACINSSTVSIHAPHEGERPPFSSLYTYSNSVSIHAPHEGERQYVSA